MHRDGEIAPGQDVEFSQYSTVTPQEQLLRERAARALTGALTTEIGRVAEQTQMARDLDTRARDLRSQVEADVRIAVLNLASSTEADRRAR